MPVVPITPARDTRSLGSAIQPAHVDLGRIYNEDGEPTSYVFVTLTPIHTFVFHEEDAQHIALAILAIGKLT